LVRPALPIFAQENPGAPHDWTHHHLVFSNPGTAGEAIRNGTYDRWLRATGDPRFNLQQSRRQFLPAAAVVSTAEPDTAEPDAITITPEASDPVPTEPLPRGLALAPSAPFGGRHLPPQARYRSKGLHADWIENMGSGASAGLGVYPAKYSFLTNSANCGNAAQPDFVVYNTGLAGTSSAASVIAYDNLYTGGCSGTVPSVYWAFNTGGTIVTSVVLSLDGSQVVFVQSSAAGAASLVILKWKASSGSPTSPVAPAAATASAYRACSAPCMTSLALSGGANDSGSAPFYNYGSDTLYIGDDSGKLHKLTGIFQGTPAEAASP
jgi:hypothetical protein